MYPALFVFDMIGTTVAPSAAIPEAFRDAFTNTGIELSDHEIAAVRGKSKRDAIAELLTDRLGRSISDQLQHRVYEKFSDRLRNYCRGGGVQAITGAAETFRWCRSVDAKVALTTGFDREIAELLLRRLGWEKSVDALICNDDVPDGRPTPFLIFAALRSAAVDSTAHVASVGDTVADLQAGMNAKVRWNFGVLSGAHDKERLAAVDHAIIINSVADLPEFEW